MQTINQKTTPAGHFEEIIKALHEYPGVSVPSGTARSRTFGSSGLKINNKIFAMITSKEQFVVKLPRERVKLLVASRIGEYFDPGHGRLMREWLVIDQAFEDRWLTLAKEAMEFVASLR